eukprot:TRINITY_DN10690_c0_g1_i2.p1 TRINITY_DN10690_c0_g1~~TRINITY_DN10690_c0_g1_i2.p1  ORF type:complete len:651 (+),score=100.93 TRINITY_DN10690_c0_g1_i2:220-1953(+)
MAHSFRNDPAIMNRPISPTWSLGCSPRTPIAARVPRSPDSPPQKSPNHVTDIDHPIKSITRSNTQWDVVVVSSLSLDWKELVKIPGVSAYELRLLWHLYFLRSRKVRVIMCTSQYIPEPLLDYYLGYLPGGVTVPDAKSRLTLVACNDMGAMSVTQKLLSRQRALARIRSVIDPDKAIMTCFNSTDAEVELAEQLGIPLIGNGTEHVCWGMKVGNRQIFRDAGVQHPDGSYISLYTEQDLARGILALLERHPGARKFMVKLNESFSGKGNAILRIDSYLAARLVGRESEARRLGLLVDQLQTSLEFVAPCETWQHYYSQFQKLGGVCELFVEGLAEAKTSPSCQVFLGAGGTVRILATHEQWLDGQVFQGCHFPANLDYAADLIAASHAIGKELTKHGVVGYIGIDFVTVRQGDGSYQHWAIEINIRMGGTTLPIMTMDLLCEKGHLDTNTSQFIATDGQPRYYTASDVVQKLDYRGLVIEDILEIVRKYSKEIEWNHRPGAPETGAIFHLISLLSEMGKCGVVCIGRSRKEARSIFDRTLEILDLETEHREGRNVATMVLTMEEAIDDKDKDDASQ